MKDKSRQAVEFARKQAIIAKNWIEFYNSIFGIGGKCSELFTTEKERVAFAKSPAYGEIMELLDACRKEHGDPSRELANLTAKANGALTVRVPKTIHAALLAEAQAEGVSLNQLCLSKLATQLQATR